MKKHCTVCGDETKAPIRAVLHHFRLVDWGQWRFWRGNIATFGFWSGVRSNLTLSFPILNTLLHWKYRKSRLVFPKGWEAMTALSASPDNSPTAEPGPEPKAEESGRG